jgi:hypothetical protein
MQPNTGTTGTQRGTGTIVPLPRWLNAADAAAALGIAERTLRKRVLQGLVQRRSDAGRSMYLVAPQQAPQAQAAGMPDAVPQARQAQQARHGTADAAPIVAALVSAVERATRAELAADALRIELDATRAELDAASAELAAARKGWARAHASSQVAQAALAALTSSPK